MTDYVVYHKAEKMGYPALDIHNLAIYTKKSASSAIGSRVWLIAGEGKPRQYYLRAMFRIGKIESSDKPNFPYRVTGTDGQLFDPMPFLNKEIWFSDFLKEQGNFAFGFNPIRNSDAESGLRSIVRNNTLR